MMICPGQQEALHAKRARGGLTAHNHVSIMPQHLAAGTCQIARLAARLAATVGWAELRQDPWRLSVLTTWLPAGVVIHADRWATAVDEALHRLLPVRTHMTSLRGRDKQVQWWLAIDFAPGHSINLHCTCPVKAP
jgi:hypothetical protein